MAMPPRDYSDCARGTGGLQGAAGRLQGLRMSECMSECMGELAVKYTAEQHNKRVVTCIVYSACDKCTSSLTLLRCYVIGLTIIVR